MLRRVPMSSGSGVNKLTVHTAFDQPFTSVGGDGGPSSPYAVTQVYTYALASNTDCPIRSAHMFQLTPPPTPPANCGGPFVNVLEKLLPCAEPVSATTTLMLLSIEMPTQ